MTISLQNNIIYGPVNSRRLGSSLGINVLSSEKKLCNFNCVYCQYGWTKIKPEELTNINNFYSVQEILGDVEKALYGLSPFPNYITLSGNGEATLHPDFNTIVEGINKIRNEYCPNSKTAILSNSTGVTEPRIRKSLSKLDVKIMKLDCGDENLFKIYNRPLSHISLKPIIKGLSELEDLTIQTLFTKGEHGNSSNNQIELWINCLHQINPGKIQIHTLDRGYPSSKIYPVTLDWLLNLEQQLNKMGFKSKVYI